ncbi:MAG: thymidine kinase [Candidatus Marinimicrobia bacterium]|jgi:thymidine kinase|nr:thymidine kinase [Candidatus Neomarinimicrobiota bacterium]MBT3617423.1 thymidine kinase [Candidatus Neomarinimicrobiota bacterium]MBT3829363.1 thymidine kinase [Candidatus Neomarinimicrobiota bacterium]MBT3997646.1 thymidine kinase [Candidatus Neomarinimicrobiota bacterium]MBT4280944.1 thymidine kinase [Candidatus Neomarinimicrobiota bacterium]
MTLSPKYSGWIEVICGSMFSGKTEELIRRLKRAEIAKMKTAIFRPAIDNRYEKEHIVSHNQSKLKSYTVEKAADIIPLTKNADVIGIDEAQFFDEEIVNICKILASNSARVVVAGLDKDYKGKPFGIMPNLMCEADYVTKLRAICVACGDPANFTQRLSKDTEQVIIGETDIYEARCRGCYQPPGKS